MSVGDMRRAGLSKQKMGYIRDLAEHALSGKVDFARLPTMTDEEVITTLTDIKGVGVWTAHMFLIFALRRLNVLAVGDLGVRTAIKRHYKKRLLPKPAHIEKLAVNWHPYCSYACWYLWRSLEFAQNGKPTTETRRHGGKRVLKARPKLLLKSRAKREIHLPTKGSRGRRSDKQNATV
jgi:3-methyladenine DNA glycosylase/8-oxoguanine DNA glycosylase